ncbi:hypothetical protein A2U01_0091988, partial [Trifolium medium]|nr:hypothetical protein [Trifolium medium]
MLQFPRGLLLQFRRLIEMEFPQSWSEELFDRTR